MVWHGLIFRIDSKDPLNEAFDVQKTIPERRRWIFFLLDYELIKPRVNKSQPNVNMSLLRAWLSFKISDMHINHPYHEIADYFKRLQNIQRFHDHQLAAQRRRKKEQRQRRKQQRKQQQHQKQSVSQEASSPTSTVTGENISQALNKSPYEHEKKLEEDQHNLQQEQFNIDAKRQIQENKNQAKLPKEETTVLPPPSSCTGITEIWI